MSAPLLPAALRRVLAVAAALHLALFLFHVVRQLATAEGHVLADGINPVGGDFINMWTAGRMVLEGHAGAIYDPRAFDAFQQAIVGSDIGHRIWAYPPHSLALATPLALLDYRLALLAWSLLGLAVLAAGARRLGFGWPLVLLLVTSPAALHCVYWGQTGNLAAGLLLMALAQRGARDGLAVAATTLLTVKPQMGFLLPAYWALGRQWGIFAAVSAAVLAVFALSLLVGGPELWSGYLFLTLPELSLLERYGTGPFMLMIPSVFMSARILGVHGDLALGLHAGFAAVMVLAVGWLWLRRTEPGLRMAVLLIGTALITPYLHIYDLTIVLVGALLVWGGWSTAPEGRGRGLAEAMLLLAWFMPYLTIALHIAGVPLMPLVMLALLLLAARAPQSPGNG